MITAHPLQWPQGWPRTPAADRTSGRFNKKERQYYSLGGSWSQTKDLTIADATERVLKELRMMKIERDDCVISTNLALRLDGLPRSNQPEPADPGVAVYWTISKGETKVMAIDLYWRVADNLAAVAATLDAMRAIERHGGAQILDRAFTGFTALPNPETPRDWRATLGIKSDVRDFDAVKNIYRERASEYHPDRGGSDERMAELNAALKQARAELQ
jgi:hypothetical protein